MKKLLTILLVASIAILFSGCYTSFGQKIYDKRVIVYKVVKKGVTTFLTEDEIKTLKLDKASTLIEYAYTVDDMGKRVADGK